jgi:transcriptional regulator with XRE-family HTH domain
MQQVREKIRSLRQAKGYSQECMAHLLGLTQATYSRLETGQTELSLAKLVAVARVLNANPWDLLTTEPGTPPLSAGRESLKITDLLHVIGHLEEEVRTLRAKLSPKKHLSLN